MATKALQLISKSKCFGGFQHVYSFKSDVLNSITRFSLYLPRSPTEKIPLIYWLSGLTCTEENFIQKSGFQRYAAEHGFAVVGPDTSPRGLNMEGATESWDLGEGAGFYVDATRGQWAKHYNMYSYVTQELPLLLAENFPVDTTNQSIMGHSMGGHGALVCYLKNPGFYKSASAFAPISNPTQCEWGKKAFTAYLGDDTSTWEEYDATLLIGRYTAPKMEILVDQGSDDQFLRDPNQLLVENLTEACLDAELPLNCRLQEGYDHSYNFVSTFIGDHFQHHAKYLL